MPALQARCPNPHPPRAFAQNGERTPQYDFVRFREIRLTLPDRDLASLTRVLTALGWNSAGEASFESNGTRVILEKATEGPVLLGFELQSASTIGNPVKHVMESIEVYRSGNSRRIINKATQLSD